MGKAERRGMETQDLKIEFEQVDDLLPYANNAKRHTDAQVEQIANSIREFGFNDPIGVWTNARGESEIVEGHGRVLAAKSLGIDRVPVIHLDRMTDQQRRAYALAHNKLTMDTGWDFDALDAELDALGMDFDIGDFGFDVGEGFEFNTDGEQSPGPATEITVTVRFSDRSGYAACIEDIKLIASENGGSVSVK